eukprot:2415265-Alexandrium_andersonii.AAC.1
MCVRVWTGGSCASGDGGCGDDGGGDNGDGDDGNVDACDGEGRGAKVMLVTMPTRVLKAVAM